MSRGDGKREGKRTELSNFCQYPRLILFTEL